ncbi:MAG: SGNH/GDSL hydrolase family protein [Ruminococcaceae bacterium]|nr:SGNH/GDSL hydrolase family protein [Oscillospiraceae bacterium]
MKRFLKILLVVVLTFAALNLLQRLLVPKYQTGIIEGSMIEEYYNEAENHDVVMIGDCELYENISPVTLYEEYGITSYIRGSAQQLVWQSYYLLEDTLRYETPKVVVFNVLSLKYDKPQSEAYNRMTLDGMEWSSAKVDAIKASMTEDEKFVEYLFPILRYHSRWSELTSDDFKYLFEKDLVTHNGYYMRADAKPCMGFPDPMPLADYTLGENAMKYLEKMTKLCKEKGIELILIKAPIEYPHWYDEWDVQMEEYAKENGLKYINFIPLQEEIGLDMTKDTYDAGLHLNVWGAEKFSIYFGKWLKENTELPDRRRDEKYSSVWEEKTKRYEKEKKQQTDELEKYGKLVSFGANAVKG